MMELEKVKKKTKKPKTRPPRELSPPPAPLTLSELEERYTDTGEQGPSTSGTTDREISDNADGNEDGDDDGVLAAEERNSSSIHPGTTGSEEKHDDEMAIPVAIPAGNSGSDRTRTEEREKNQEPDAKILPKNDEARNEKVKDADSAYIPVHSIYPIPIATSESDSRSENIANKATKTDNSAINAATSGIYPSEQLNEMKTPFASVKIDGIPQPIYSERVKERTMMPHGSTVIREAPAAISKTGTDIIDGGATVYPSLSLEKNVYGLLTENQLLAFYQNQMYETVEDFVDEFLEHEEFPKHNLHEYLKRYKEVCEHIVANEIDVAECERLVKECAQASWTAENHVIKQEGRCGDQKYATGSATYLVATFHPEKVTELSRLLKRDASSRLDSSLSFQIQMRSLALQIQWRIVAYNNAFMMEHRLNTNSPPYFLPGDGGDTISRRNLRNALSDLFHFLRYPNLPTMFINSVSGWISELVAILLKACTADDQQYLLCQILRLVSPVSQWAAPLLQSYIEIDSINDRPIIDNCIAMLSILLSSIRGRENFLRRVVNFESENNSWVVVSDEGTEKDASLVTVNEIDLIAFLNQFTSEAVFAKAIRHFAITLGSSPRDQALTLMAFELVLIKIFNDGLRAYGSAEYRQFCKQIGYALRQSVRCLAEFFKINKEMLSIDEADMVQKEFDRIVLHAVYYIVSKQNLGLWQFVVDLPYDVISATCRMRCQILLRRRLIITVEELYELPDADLPHLVKTAGSLLDKLPDLPSDDRIYMVSALSAVISASDEDVEPFVLEIINVCFLDVSMRDHFYKVGAETIGILIDKHPRILQRILLLIDRNLDALDEYAVEVLSVAPLSKCRLSPDDVGVICGKWLINKPADHPASRIARRVLASMNWGTDPKGQLWLPQEVHIVCADTIVKGHMAQCKTTNGLISKSWNKVAKLASKVPDYEHQFDTFCWDILVRLKLPTEIKNLNFQSVNDLASFFLFTIQRSLISVDEFLLSGVSLWSELITSGCYAASVVILSRLVSSFPDSVSTLISNSSFTQCLDRLLLCDQSSYAIQLIAGADKFPGPTVRLLASAIMYHLNEKFSQTHLNGWLQLLCCKRPTQWNTDKSTLYLLGVLVRMAFVRDQTKILGIPDFLVTSYAILIQQWKDGSKGVLSWFTGDDTVPVLIDVANFTVSPWASYALLLAEQQSHDAFYEAFYQTTAKHPKNDLAQSVKKAATKSHVNLPVEQLHFHRWLQFVSTDGIREHPIFPLALENLAIHLYSRKTYMAAKVCFGEKYLTCAQSQPLFEELRKKILPQAEYSSEKNVALFYKAFTQWLSNPKICSASFHSYEDFLLDHLLQFIVAGDLHPWVEYMDMDDLRRKINDGRKLYIFACHLGSFAEPPRSAPVRNLTQLITQFSKQNQAKPYPSVPLHPTLPREVSFDFIVACDSRRCLAPFATELKEINESARSFVGAKDQIEVLDDEYVAAYPDLYTKSATELAIVLKCGTTFGSRCLRPVTSTVTVAASQYQTAVEAKMKANRQKRSGELAGAYSRLFEPISLHCAQLENIASKMYDYIQNVDDLPGIRAKQLRDAGRVLFYHLTSSVTSLEMIFPASADSYGFVLSKLGKGFIANNPHEQRNLMRVVLNGSHLAHLLTPHFTPHCVPSTELLDLYTSLSQAVRNPAASSAALSLLSQLDIKNAGDRLPPQQFSQLMPAAFENLTSVSDPSSPLFDVCTKHFIHSVFHRFPSNFVDGLKLVLAACDTKSTPVCIFDEFIKHLGADNLIATDTKPEHIIDTMTAVTAGEAMAVQFRKSRNELSTRLYNVWANYLSKVLLLAEFFLYKSASLSFDSQRPIAKLESELRQVFESCIQVFGPLLEPFGAGFAPWNPADAESAAVVLERFVSLMEQLHLLYDAYFPPGSENLITLFWRYYAEKLAVLTRGGSHVHQVMESRFINIPWHLFWPSLYDLASMDKIMTEGAPESAPLLTQIVVRIPWLPLIQYQVQQPMDAHRAFYSLLFSLLASCTSRPTNYTICRASMPKLISSLIPFPWHLIEMEQLSAVSKRIANIFSSNVLTDPNDVTNAFFELYRRVCFFGTISVTNVPLAEVCQKQSFYIRTQLALMLRNSSDRTLLSRFYEDQIKAVHNIVPPTEQPMDSQTFLSHELTSFWSDISDNKFLETFSSTLLDWIERNGGSPVILLLMNTVVNSLKPNQILLAVKVVEKCIVAYFGRTGQCEWNVVLKWIVLSDRCRQSLFTPPSSESTISFSPLCGYAFVTKELMSSSSIQQETGLLRDLIDFVTTIKPRYVTDEAAFLLLIEKLQKIILRQYNHSITQANHFLMHYLEWLGRVHSDDKSSSFFSMIGLSKKQPYSIKMRYICHLMELYISQQMIAPDRPPRNAFGSAVLNSRIQAFRDLCAQKQYTVFQSTSQLAQPYFIQVQEHHIVHIKELFAHIVRSLYNEKYIHDIVANAGASY